MSSPLGNFEDDLGAWRIKVTGRGPLTGVRFYEVEIQSVGAHSGGDTDGEWFDLGETRYDDAGGVDLLVHLLTDYRHLGDDDSVTLAEDVLVHMGKEIPQ